MLICTIVGSNFRQVRARTAAASSSEHSKVLYHRIPGPHELHIRPCRGAPRGRERRLTGHVRRGAARRSCTDTTSLLCCTDTTSLLCCMDTASLLAARTPTRPPRSSALLLQREPAPALAGSGARPPPPAPTPRSPPAAHRGGGLVPPHGDAARGAHHHGHLAPPHGCRGAPVACL